MPARAAAAPGAVPAGKLGRRGLPQHEIAGIALVGRHLDAGAGQQFLGAAARELAVLREAGHGEQHVALRGVGVVGGDQALDDPDHLRDVAGGARLHVRGQHAEGGDVAVVVLGGALGQRGDGDAQIGGAGVDLVLHVREVPGVGEPRVQPPQQPRQHVVDDGWAGVADMGEVVDGRAADVHPDMRGVDRLEPLLAAGAAVVQVEIGHGPGQCWEAKGGFSGKSRAAGNAGAGVVCAGRAGTARTPGQRRARGVTDMKGRHPILPRRRAGGANPPATTGPTRSAS